MADVWVLVVDEDSEYRRARTVTADLIAGPVPGHTSSGEVIETRTALTGVPLRLVSTDDVTPSGAWWHFEILDTGKSWDRRTPGSIESSESSPILVGDLPAVVAGEAPPSWDAASIGAIPAIEKGTPGGVATLDGDGLVPAENLPPAAAGVASVNGQTGAVVLGADDVGADVTGSAASALTEAQSYTDTAVANKVDNTDPRLSDARTPTAHAASHGSGGSDPVTVAQSQVTGLGDALAAKLDVGAIWTGTEAEYAALTPNDGVLYFTVDS